MKRLILVLVSAAALAAPAKAANWHVLGETSGRAGRSLVYVDADTIKREAERVHFRSETRFADPMGSGIRLVAMSEVDCSTMKLTIASEARYRGASLVAIDNVPREVSYPSEGTDKHQQLKRLCGSEFAAASVRSEVYHGRNAFAALSRTSAANGR